MRSPAQPAYADQQEQPIVKMAFFLSISWIERGGYMCWLVVQDNVKNPADVAISL